MNLATKILTVLTTTPTRTALTLLDAAGHPSASYTRAQLLERAGAWSTRIRLNGALPGGRVAVALARDLDLAAVHVAALATGTPIVPINTALADRELVDLLKAAKPALVIADPTFAESHIATARASGCPWWLTGLSALGDNEPFSTPNLSQVSALTACPTTDDAAALVLFTSGTTGRAKSVPLSHKNLSENLAALETAWSRSDADRLLHMLPAHHFHGLVLALYGSLSVGNEISLLQRFEARAVLDALQSQRCNLTMGVPTMYARMLDAAEPADDLSGLTTAISGSAPLPLKTWEAFHERFDVKLVERYGLTETCIVTTNPIDAPRPGSVGRALAGTDVAFFHDDGYHSEAGASGEICVRSASVTAGYGNDPEANASSFRDGWFHTGDLGRIDDRGSIWIDGRIKELIIVGGSNVVPGEVEKALDDVEGVSEIAVAGAPDDDLGEVVAAFVVATDADTQALEQRLRQTSGSTLAGYKRPRRYVFLQALPRNAMGKIDRAALSAGL